MPTFEQFPTLLDDPDYHFFQEAAQRNPRYPVAAYCYLAKCLWRIVQEHNAKHYAERHGNIGGKDLCYIIRDNLIHDYGRMTLAILAQWNIFETADFGNIFYELIALKLLSATPDDSREDFNDVFDFKKEFTIPLPGKETPNATWEIIE